MSRVLSPGTSGDWRERFVFCALVGPSINKDWAQVELFSVFLDEKVMVELRMGEIDLLNLLVYIFFNLLIYTLNSKPTLLRVRTFSILRNSSSIPFFHLNPLSTPPQKRKNQKTVIIPAIYTIFYIKKIIWLTIMENKWVKNL